MNGVVSLEKAKRLKELGLKWGPCFGDWVYIDGEKKMVTHVCEGEFGEYKDIRCLSPVLGVSKGVRDLEFTWLPSLSQLLEQIETRGYIWEAGCTVIIGTAKRSGYYVTLFKGEYVVHHETQADTPEDACADALLWILEQEAKGS